MGSSGAPGVPGLRASFGEGDPERADVGDAVSGDLDRSLAASCSCKLVSILDCFYPCLYYLISNPNYSNKGIQHLYKA